MSALAIDPLERPAVGHDWPLRRLAAADLACFVDAYAALVGEGVWYDGTPLSAADLDLLRGELAAMEREQARRKAGAA